MHKIMQLKDELLEELESFAGKSKNKDDVMLIKCLASACDHLCNVVEAADEGEYSNRMSRRSYREYTPGRVYDDGMSMRSRDSRGRYAVERGRAYSGDDHIAEKLEDMMEDADDNSRRAIQKALQMIRG